MRHDQLAIQQFQNAVDQVNEISRETDANFNISTLITTSQTLNADFPRLKVDCSAGNIQLIFPEATQIGEFTWIIERIDTSSNSLTFISTDVTQLINGLTEWRLNPYESMEVNVQYDKFSVK